MPLSEDQKAMLRLLAQREQGYDDLAALMGLSVDEVRAKVADALAELEAEGKPAPELPAEPAPAPEPVESAPAKPAAPPAPAPAPKAPEPEQAAAAPVEPTPAAEPAKPADKPKRTPPPRPKLSFPGGGARAAIVAGIAVVVLLVAILVIGGGDSDNGGGETTTSAGAAASEQAVANGAAKEITQAILEPVDGSDAEGVASFGRVKNSLALQIEASGLAPTAKGETYTVWLADSPQKMLPLATTTVDSKGKIGAQVVVPTEVLGFLANETFTQIAVTLTDEKQLQASLAAATKAKEAPAYTGTEVLSGTVTGPIVGAASR